MTSPHDFDTVVTTMVVELHRIMVYPQMGFQIHQTAPEDVIESFNILVKAGYTSHLVKQD